MSDTKAISKRDFLRKSVLTGAGAVGATALATPYVKAQAPIKWRLQTYAGPALADHVCKPGVEAFNKAAHGEMEIEMYTADQLVPQGELFRAVQSGTLDAAQSDDDSAAAPVDVKVFGAYFPLASRYSLDVPALWHWHGLKEIWEEAYAEIPGVTWLSSGAWDPCNFGTTKPIKSIDDLKGLRVYTFPTGGQFLSRFGVVPVTLPYEDVEVALQTGELDGVCWCGITEMHTVGWANALKYFLTNPLSGAWAGSYFVNTDKWKAVPEHLQTLFMMAIDTSHYYRQHWYWAGEAKYRNEGKLELTTVPADQWKQVEDEATKFWDEIASQSPRSAKVVEIIKKYNESMVKAGAPYRYS
ncbi:MAG: TRAP transporter substrate-binding protein [Mesorhizobium sp.]|jgi:TRAP-type mannitol/chloroaromatic compound transport system substrate-binding protein|uniref:TRAP transporter substrate-binding protein n=1 Tax=Aquamicrobium soli TaxID=1811518 RepID=A0ABV7KEX3_9HYPH